MFVMASKHMRVELNDAEQKAVAEVIRAQGDNMSTKPEGVMSRLDKIASGIQQESDPSELAYYIRVLGGAVNSCVEWNLLGKHIDTLNASCSMLPVLVDALNTNTPVHFEFA